MKNSLSSSKEKSQAMKLDIIFWTHSPFQGTYLNIYLETATILFNFQTELLWENKIYNLGKQGEISSEKQICKTKN